MFKRSWIFLLIVTLLNLPGGGFIFAQTKIENDAAAAGKIKTEIVKLGTGEKAKVKVELFDKTIVRGFVSAVEEDSFSVTNQIGSPIKVAFSQVKKVSGKNMSKEVKTAIIVAAIAVPTAILLLFLGKYYCNEQAC